MAINKNKLMDAARKARDKGQIDKAIKEYLKIVREDPKDVRVWLKIGDLFAKRGAKQEATETYLKVARFYSEQGFYLKAVAVYKQILKLDSRLVEVNLKLAELYRQLGLLSDAMQHFEMVAAFFHREGKTREALATIRQLVDLDPENVATRIKLAELYSKEGMVDAAVTEFGHACDYLRKHNRIEDFIKVAERLLWHKPDTIALNRELANLYLTRGDPRRALQKLQACFKANPRDVETLALLARAFQALEQKGKTVSVLKEMARVLVEAGKRREAEEVHRQILTLVPGDPDSKAFLGMSRPGRETGQGAPVADQVLEPAPPRASARRPAAAYNPTGSLPIVDPAELDQFEADSEAYPELGDTGANLPGSAYRIAAAGNEIETDLVAELALDDDFSDAESSVRGEVHADEIVKILTETDVYVKYGLHQKAIDHLHKVFSLDPLSIEARERLKDVLLAQGRTDEALGELCKLAEQVAPANPGRAEAYLREVLALSPDDPRASALAARYRLDLGGDDLEIIAEEHAPVGLGSGLLGPDPDDDEPSESFGRRAAGSGAVPVVDEEMDLDELDLEPVEDGEVESAITEDDQNYAPDEHNYYAGARGPSPASRYEADGFEFELGLGDEDDEPMLDSEAPRVASRRADSVDPRETLEVHLDQVEEAVSIADVEQEDVQFGAPPAGDLLAGPYDDGAQEEDLPFDPIDARRFDAEPGYDQDLRGALESAGDSSSILAPTGEEMPATYVPGVHLFNLSETPSPSKLGPPPPVAPPHLDPLSDLDDEDIAFDFIADVGGAPSGAPASRTMQAKVGQTVDQPLLDAGAEGDSQQGGGTSLEDDLDEADFFVGQSLWDEAREILQALLSRYPNHPLVLAKLRDADSMAAGLEPLADVLSDEAPALPELSDDAPYRESPPVAEEPRSGTGIGPGPAHVTKPVVLLEKPVEDNDGDTHYDLGLAYKEMGLHEEAIKAFQKVLTMPGREVQCHLMIGLCHREQGNLSEAINQFKAGLYVDRITLAEKFGLYYEIGTCYEALEDPQEALYYYEMVLKKDAGYRDLAPRVSAIRTSMGANGNASSSGGKRQSTLDSETDSALDHIKR